MSDALLAALLGLGGGTTLGMAARWGDFCTFGAIESAYYGNNQTRLRMWGIVLATAIAATFLLDANGHIDITQTLYHRITWNPITSILGGLMFGYGMALAGNCGFGALARFGGGDLRSMIVVIVIAISGYVILSGPLAELRLQVFPTQQSQTPQGIAHMINRATGLQPIAIALPIALAMAAWALSYQRLRQAPSQILWAIAAGLAIASAFWGTSVLNTQSFNEIAVEGHTYTAPLGKTLLFIMTSSGGGLGFPIGSVFGVLLGAAIASIIKGQFRWEACEDPRELGRQVIGAILMGLGGVIALGCSVGQGLSAFATLAYSAPITLIAIAIGALIGLRHMILGLNV